MTQHLTESNVVPSRAQPPPESEKEASLWPAYWGGGFRMPPANPPTSLTSPTRWPMVPDPSTVVPFPILRQEWVGTSKLPGHVDEIHTRRWADLGVSISLPGTHSEWTQGTRFMCLLNKREFGGFFVSQNCPHCSSMKGTICALTPLFPAMQDLGGIRPFPLYSPNQHFKTGFEQTAGHSTGFPEVVWVSLHMSEW